MHRVAVVVLAVGLALSVGSCSCPECPKCVECVPDPDLSTDVVSGCEILDDRGEIAGSPLVKALIRQIQNNFNASVAEVGAHDIYQKAEIGFALVGTDQRLINSKSDKILNMLDDGGLAELIDNELEIIHL